MRSVIKILLFLFFILSSAFAFGDSKTDSLLTVLKNTINEKDKSLLLLNIAGLVSTNDSVIFYSNQALNSAAKINNDSLRLACYRNLVRSYQQKPFAEDSALVYVPLIDKINRENSFNELAYLSNATIATLYTQLHQYDAAIKYSQQSLDAAKLTGDEKKISRAKNNLGEVYRKASLFNRAKEVFEEAAENAIKQNDIPNIISGYRGIAICYDMTKDYANAEKYFQLSLDFAAKDKNERTIYSPLGNLAVAQWHLKKYDDAIVNLNKAVVIAKKYNLIQIQSDYKNLADVYKDKGDYDSAIYYGSLSLALAEKNNEKLLQNIDHKILADAYKLKGDYKLAYEHVLRSQEIGDSLKIKEREKANAEAEAAYNVKEKKSKIELLNKENEIQKLTLHEKEQTIYLASIKATQTKNEINLLNQSKALQALKLSQTQQELDNRELETKASIAELELTKKDKLIKEKQLAEQTLYRNIIVVGSLFIIVLGLLLFNRFRLNKKIESQQALLNERKRISNELHDDLGAQLSTARMFLNSMKNNTDGDKNKMLVENSIQLIDGSINDLRKIMDDLQASTLQQQGYLKATEELINKINQLQQINFSLSHSGLEKRLQQNTEHHLFRITQELINNSMKYAKAKNVTIDLVNRDGTVVLLYEDDGIGFDIKNNKRGYGLTNIETRTQNINGIVEFDSSPGNGARTIIELPLVYA